MIEREFLEIQPKGEILKKRTEKILADLKKDISSQKWQGVALSKEGQITAALEGIKENTLPLLISQLESYQGKEEKKIFAEGGTLDGVIKDLLLVYTLTLGRKFKNPTAFSGERPQEWEKEKYWQLAQSISCHYPNEALPLIQMMSYARRKDNSFEVYLENGEEKTNYSIGQPIEPQKLGFKIEGLPNERLSPRQAIGLLIEWKKETSHVAEEIVSLQNS